MRKLLLLFLMTTAIFGCTTVYDGNTRLIIQGKITDKNQNALAGQHVKILVYNTDDDNYYQHSDLISYANSDAEGHFQLIIPAPENQEKPLSVTIYSDNGYQDKEFRSIKRKHFSDYKLDLNTIPLYKQDEIAELLLFAPSDGAYTFRDITLEGIEAESVVSFEPEIPSLDTYWSYKVLKNQTVIIHYKVDHYTGSGIETTTHDVPLTIGNQSAVNYTLTF